MRIIDKNQDLYDYLQDSTDTLVFDRRGSFLLSKKDLGYAMANYCRYYDKNSIYRFLLLQCGYQYWLILATITHYDNSNSVWSHNESYIKENIDYKFEIVKTWKNYNKKRNLLYIDLISFSYKYLSKDYKTKDFNYTDIFNKADILAKTIDNNDYKVEHECCPSINYRSHKNEFIKEERKFPLLKACGIGNLIDPIDIFTAIEEHFSLEKTEAERIEPIGATNNDKIIMHGFDTKVSFRGK